jgi:hypothetical protein
MAKWKRLSRHRCRHSASVELTFVPPRAEMKLGTTVCTRCSHLQINGGFGVFGNEVDGTRVRSKQFRAWAIGTLIA